MISVTTKHYELTNDNLWSTDFARSERLGMIASTQKSDMPKKVPLVSSLSTRGVWMTDVSAMDRRSIKAQLAGRGDFRAAWWNLNCYLHRWAHPGISLEQIMAEFQVRQRKLAGIRMSAIRRFDWVKHAFRQRLLLVLRKILSTPLSPQRKSWV